MLRLNALQFLKKFLRKNSGFSQGRLANVWALNPKNMKKRLLATLVTISFLLPQIALAKDICIAEEDIPKDLEITALYPNPNTGEDEWIEIKNTGKTNLELAFYTIEDTTNKPYPLEGTLEAGESTSITGFSFQLNNSNETVTLKTIAGDTVDTFSYETSTKGQAIEKDAQVETASETTSEDTTEPTETETEVITPVTPTLWPIFSEAMPNPEGSDSTEEWIELYNPYDQALTMDGLKLDDEDGGSSPYGLTGTLEAESYLLVSIQDSKLTLNNTVDHIRLLGANDEILWDISYEDTTEGKSYALIGDSYVITTPTPGEENIAPESTTENADASEEATESDTNYQDGDLSENVEITEVFPNPEGPDQEEEWIELTNGGTIAVNLGNWILDDGPGGSDPYIIPDNFIIEPGQTLIIYRTESGIALNNSNETVEIVDYNGEIMDEISYESSEEGESYSQITVEETATESASIAELGQSKFDIWEWTIPSPGEPNPIWKQIKGDVESFDGSLLTLFDGTSNWTFKANQAQTDELLFKIGNTVLVQASMENGLYKIMTSELIKGAEASQKTSIPWGLIATVITIAGWLGYEAYKKRQKTLHFGPEALN